MASRLSSLALALVALLALLPLAALALIPLLALLALLPLLALISLLALVALARWRFLRLTAARIDAALPRIATTGESCRAERRYGQRQHDVNELHGRFLS